MSTEFVRRRYRARVATIGAEAVEGNVDFVLGLGELVEPPVAYGSTVHPLHGSTEMQPFTIDAIDIDAFVTGAFTQSERTRAIGRLIDVQWDTWDAGAEDWEDDWTSYVVGRVSEFGQPDGSGKYRAQVSDESWKLRNRRPIFTENDTCQLWPAGVRYPWRGFRMAWTADGTLESSDGNTHVIKMIAGGPAPAGSGTGGAKYRGREVTSRLVSFVRADALPKDDWEFGAAVTRGNFNHLRVNYAGADYEVVSFGSTLMESLEEPEITLPQSEFRTVTVWALVYSVSTPPSSGEAFLWAPTHAPAPGFPLHIGVDTTGRDPHAWGIDGGWLHKADLTRRVFDAAEVLYSTTDMDEWEDDLSYTLFAGDVEEVPSDPLRWLEDRVWSGEMRFQTHDITGKLTTADLRPPREIPLDTPVLDATNSMPGPWSHRGHDMRNSFVTRYKSIEVPEEIGTPITVPFPTPGQPIVIALPPGGPGIIFDPSPDQDVRLDSFIGREWDDTPYEGPEEDSTIVDAGRRQHVLDHRGTLDPKQIGAILAAQSYINAGRGTLVDEVMLLINPAMLATFQDGPVVGRITVNRALGETIKEGQILYLNRDSLKLTFNTGVSLPPSVGPIDPGSEDPPELEDDAPTLGSLTLNADRSITVPVASVPAGQTARVEYTTGPYASAPDDGSAAWLTADTVTSPGSVEISVRPIGTETWVRVSGEIGGVRVTEFSTAVQVSVAETPYFVQTRLTMDDGGNGTASWTASGLTLGVKLSWEVMNPGDTPTYPNVAHFSGASGYAVIPAVPDVGEVLAVKYEAYPGWTGVAVSGTVGESVTRSLQRQSVLSQIGVPNTLGNFLQFTAGAYPARNNYFRTHTYVGTGLPGPDSIDGDVWIRPPA